MSGQPFADLSPVVGRHFVSLAGNVCQVRGLGPGAIRVTWIRRESEADRTEFSAWVEGVIQQPLDIEVSVGLEQEQANYQEWKRKSGF